MPLFAMLGGIGTLIVLWVGGREVIAGRLSVGSLVAFNGYLALLSWPTFALGWIIGIWQRGIAGLDAGPRAARGDARDRRPRARQAAGPDLPHETGAPSIEVRELTIAVEGRKLLDGVSFELAAGATLAVVGRTGAGKTTLVDALVRLQDVAPGTVRSPVGT